MANTKNKAILDNANEKIKYFNRTGIHYEVIYHYVIRKRKETKEIYDKDFLDDIVAGLISFDMQRMMGKKKYIAESKNSWAAKLNTVLKSHKSALKRLRSYILQNINLNEVNIKKTIEYIFDDLAKSGEGGLNQRRESESFPVGASKILHFILPDLFIILDSNARRELINFYEFPKGKIDGALYLKAMGFYQKELKKWAESNSDPQFKKLLAFDSSWKKFDGVRPTPLPRIIDKCTFVGNDFY